MPHDFRVVEKDIAINGLFSEYLPSCFNLVYDALTIFTKQKCDLIPPYRFTMSRYNNNDSRREIFIPEIGAYSVLKNYIKTNKILEELITFSETDTNSFSPVLNTDDSIMWHEQSYDTETGDSIATDVEDSNYVENIGQKLTMAIGAKSILRLDIANCYSSFYLHMIPTIVLGFDKADAEFNKKRINSKDPSIDTTYLKYDGLDKVVRQQNLNRTNGLLTGILYSKIIAEAMFTRIDIELTKANIKFSRFVDDYEVYLYNNEEKQVISTFQSILRRYGFALNHEKTSIIEFPYYIVENLSKLFKDYNRGSLETESIIQLFNTFLRLEASGTKGAIRFLIKSLEKDSMKTSNIELYKSYLLSILANNERSITKVCSVLIKDKGRLMLNVKELHLVRKLLIEHIRNEHELEVVWLVYLLIETNNINGTDCDKIVSSKNELAIMMLLRRGLLTKEQILSVVENATSWILLYELFAMDNIDKTNLCEKLHLEKNADLYYKLKEKGIHFCYG